MVIGRDIDDFDHPPIWVSSTLLGERSRLFVGVERQFIFIYTQVFVFTLSFYSKPYNMIYWIDIRNVLSLSVNDV